MSERKLDFDMCRKPKFEHVFMVLACGQNGRPCNLLVKRSCANHNEQIMTAGVSMKTAQSRAPDCIVCTQ